MCQSSEEPAIYIDSEVTRIDLGLPESYLYAFVRESDPRVVVGHASGQIFMTHDKPEFAPDMCYYRITLADGRSDGLFADSDRRAVWMLGSMYSEELVTLLEKEFTVRSIVWTSRSIEL